MELLTTIAITIFTLALLVTVHEYGHFWVARRCGVKVLRFSIGFGKPLYSWHDDLGTEYVIAAIPLGGYVKMLDEREADVAEDELHLAFNRKPVMQRIAVVVAGPAANFILAILAFWLVYLSGETGYAPVVGSIKEGSIAEVAGLESGQEIVAVDGHPTPTWQALNLRLLDRIGETGPIRFSVQYPGAEVVYESLGELDNWLADAEIPDLIGGLGIELYRPPIPPLLEEVVGGSPADRAGLLAGDLIMSADGVYMDEWVEWVRYVRARPGEEILLSLERDARVMDATITPATLNDGGGEPYGQVGVTVVVPEWPAELIREFEYGPIEALGVSLERTGQLSMFTLTSIKKMIMGLISTKNLSGPITIAKVASESAKSGLESYIAFLALLSISLGVLNLLPIPVLDGGHLLYYCVELVVGKPVPERVQMVGYQLGLFIILGVMGLALYNDFARL
ncbi:MAG: regulator of sigma E protease [Halieaceae bacterium]